MVGIGVFVVWVGYSLLYYGIDQVRGGNNGFLSLVIPGKYTDQPNDIGGSEITAQGAANEASVQAMDATAAAQTKANKPTLGLGGLGTGNTPTGVIPAP